MATGFAADRPFVIEAMVDPAAPMLPPLMPESKAEGLYAALEQEDGGGAVVDRVRRQRAADAGE